jgi:hypothetical protein
MKASLLIDGGLRLDAAVRNAKNGHPLGRLH